MPFNGSGTFNPLITFVPNTLATAEDQNAQDTDFASGLTDCMTRDGQSPATDNISMGGFQLNDLGNGVNPTDAANVSQLTALVSSGIIVMYGGASAPSGYLLCNGFPYSRTTYASLFAAIGTTFGVGDGSTTFNVPDLRSRAPIGAGQGSGLSNRVLASTGGEETHTLTTPEIPSHSHTDSGHTHSITDPGHNHTPGVTSNGFLLDVSAGGTPYGTGPGEKTTVATTGTSTTGITATNSGTANIQNTGGGGSHNNMQPWLSVNFIIKT